MPDVVVDSSVVVKWILPEADTDIAMRVQRETVSAGGRLIALDLAAIEIANAVWKRFHRGFQTEAEAMASLELLWRSPLHYEAAEPVLRAAFEIALKYNSAVYDACFVALVGNLGADGVTADVPLYKAVHNDFPRIKLLSDW